MNLTARIAAIFNRPGAARDNAAEAAAMPAVSSEAKGSGAPAAKLLGLLAISLVALFATTASAASAAPLAAKTPQVSNVSYTTAHVTGKISSPAEGFGGFTTYAFSYSLDQTNWTPGPEGSFGGLLGAVPPFEDKEVEGDIASLTTGTKYFVRLTVANNGNEATSPGPNPEFTTLIAESPTIPGAVSASPILSTSATGNAEVNRPVASDDVECRFEYVSDEDFAATGFAGATERSCDQNPIGAADAATDKKVTAALGCTNPLTEDPEGKCLKPETTYHLRLAADNAAPGVVTKDAASTFTTASPVAKPTVIAANDATDVSYFTAKVSGVVQRPAGADPALNTACRFEYVTDEDFGTTGFAGAASAPCAEAPPEAPLTSTSTGPTPVSAELSGLKGAPTGTTYHLRLNAYNAGGSDFKEASTFTTLPSEEPTFEIDPVSPADVGYTTAEVSGSVDLGKPQHEINAAFQLSPNPPEGWFGTGNVFGTQEGIKYSQLFLNLKPGTKYYVRMFGYDIVNGEVGGILYFPEPYESFTTAGSSAPPIASLDPISLVTGTTARFSGTVDANAPDEALPDDAKAAYKTDWQIECVPECKDANGNVIAGTVEAEEGAKSIEVDAKRLEPGTHYEEVKLVATNILGTVETPVQTFDTDEIPPTVKQTTGASDGKGGYNLQGVVNPNNQTVTACEFRWGPDAPAYAFSAPCSPPPSGGSKPITVEAHLTSLNTGVNYHALLVVKYGAGSEAKGVDQEFKATLDSPESCPNEQIRKENSSSALPECRAYEMVSPPGKEGFPASLKAFYGGERAIYNSGAGNIANSGSHLVALAGGSNYVAARTAVGWATIPNHRTSGSFSEDLLSSLTITEESLTHTEEFSLRNPDGSVTRIGPSPSYRLSMAGSADLSHIVAWGTPTNVPPWGRGGYEYVGTGNSEPRRVDVDNSGEPISTCVTGSQQAGAGLNALGKFISGDGRVIVFAVAGFCGGGNPPAEELWARVNGTTSIDVSASQCNRTAPACNPPVGEGGCGYGPGQVESGPGCRNLQFQGAAKDGSRVFFTTKRQLVDADTDEGNDLYACDIPAVTPAPVGKGNPCAALREVSAGAPTGADVESVATVSDNGATVLFAAKGVLAANKDALGEQAVAGDHNLYAWRTDGAHPAGQTTFLARLDTNDLGGEVAAPQTTPDGRYLAFATTNQLVPTDTDNARDLYRYDVDAGQLTRLSTNVFGVAGNGEGFDVLIRTPAVSDDGQKVVFTTAEALSPADGNGETDVYLWTPSRVSLISTGAVGAAATREGLARYPAQAVISGSGRDIYFETPGALTPADGDDLGDVYDARIGGGFSFAQPDPCSGEACRTPPSSSPPAPASPTNRPNGEGNVKPKTCPKGKIRKKSGKCVKKPKKHSGKKHSGKKISHRQGGGK